MSRGFEAASYDLGRSVPGLTLSALPPEACAGLATVFAAMEPWSRYPIGADELAGYLATIEPGAPRLALCAHGEIAGVVGLRIAWLRGPYLQFLAMLPAYQGRSYGEAVLTWLVTQASLDDADSVFVCVSDFNSRARAFYATHGFEVVGDLPDLVRPGRTEVLMRRRVSKTTA